MEHYDIIIAGGGMVGATLAAALAQAGRTVAVVEARLPPSWQADTPYTLRVSAINRASQHLFEQLGIWNTLLSRHASAYRRMVVWDANSVGEITFDALDLGEPDLGHIIENQVIQQTVLEHLGALDRVTLLAPHAVESISFEPTHVRVKLDEGSSLRGRLLIGADGARSRVRELAGICRVSRPYAQTALVTTVTTQAPHQETAWQRFLPTGPLAFLPLSNGQSSIVWSTIPAEAERLLALNDVDFLNELMRSFNRRLGHLSACGPRATFPLVGGQSYPYVKPRLALVGDAAHTIHPLAGQGVNLGLMDVAALTMILASTRRDPGSLLVLRRYERARRGENELTMRTMEGLRGLFGLRLPLWPELRGQGMRLIGRTPSVQRLLMRQALGIAGSHPDLALPPLDAPR